MTRNPIQKMKRTRKPTITTSGTPGRPFLSPYNVRKKVGRPLKFETVAQMEAAITSYFESCWGQRNVKKVDTEGNESTTQEPIRLRPYTISGLASHLNMARVTLLEYQHDQPLFTATIVEAKAYIESYAEEQLYVGKGSANGIMFSMKNNFNSWNDTSRKEITGADGQPLALDVTNDERAKETRANLLGSLGPEMTC